MFRLICVVLLFALATSAEAKDTYEKCGGPYYIVTNWPDGSASRWKLPPCPKDRWGPIKFDVVDSAPYMPPKCAVYSKEVSREEVKEAGSSEWKPTPEKFICEKFEPRKTSN